MNDVDFVFDAPRPPDSKPLHELFERELRKAQQLDIVVGYVSAISLCRLREAIEERPEMVVNLTCGMHGVEGMTTKQLTHARTLHSELSAGNRGGVFVTSRMKYHGKIYLFRTDSATSCYIGSANLGSIVPSHSDTFEAGVYFHSVPEYVLTHLARDVYPRREPIDTARIPILPDRESPMHSVEEAQELATSEVVKIMTSPAQHTFYIPLKAEGKSNLNAHLGGRGGRAQKSGNHLARSWFEGEMIVPKSITSLASYPSTGIPFTVVTDDGWTFECKTGGGNNKNLRSKGKLSTLGTWMKSRFIEAGALEFGEFATADNIRRFGRKYLTMKYHPDFDVWSFDLSVNENTPLETPAQITKNTE